ncbi:MULTISPECIES: hypothetical protein [Cupriavidus]|uniref:hypothetical protein n=1 Tax=Cupriavidus TaxID=106589 RepID=UPI000AD9961B|nr:MULTISPECIES: hypothetical protein [Cupriavidus]
MEANPSLAAWRKGGKPLASVIALRAGEKARARRWRLPFMAGKPGEGRSGTKRRALAVRRQGTRKNAHPQYGSAGKSDEAVEAAWAGSGGRRYAARSDMAFGVVAALPRQLEHPMLLPT